MQEERYLTVGALTKYIKYKFDCDVHLSNILLTGEISNFKHHNRGHFYFTLKDDKAQISCMMFASNASKVLFEPKDGMKVYVKGNISVYEPGGYYQVSVREMKDDGIGDLYLKFEALKKELQAAGFFDEAHKRPIKRIPSTIGVITSPTGAAIRDIINTVRRRYPLTRIIVYPALVQGVLAKDSIVSQIQKANKDGLCDTLIVGRGGGSIEDLWAFNERVVALAIYNSKIPVISAVGHEVDYTIADFVADVRAATPTAAAELATPSIDALKDAILYNVKHMKTSMSKLFENLKLNLAGLDKRLDSNNPMHKLKEKRQSVSDITRNLGNNINNILDFKRNELELYNSKLKVLNPTFKIEDVKKNILNIISRLNFNVRNVLDLKRKEFDLFEGKLKALSPMSIMDKGYSISMVGDRVVKSIKDVNIDDNLSITLSDGIVSTRVLEVKNNGK